MVKRFIIQIMLLTAFFIIASAIIFCHIKPDWYSPSLIFSLIFIVLLTMLIYFWLYRTSRKNAKRFDAIFRLSLFVKMFAAVAFIVPLVIFYEEHVMIIVPFYITLYISYSFLMTKTTIKMVRNGIEN